MADRNSVVDCLIYLLLFVLVGTQAQRFQQWQTWAPCSFSCGQGIQERLRNCTRGRCVQKEMRGCHLGTCPEKEEDSRFKEWQEWGRCSTTCGQGIKERKRACVSGGCVQTETMTCRIKNCPGDDSSTWLKWSACSTTCGMGVARRTRQCPVGNCIQKQVKNCHLKPCPNDAGPDAAFHPWQDWSGCSATCGSGTRARVRRCKELDCQEREIGSCTKKPCRRQDNVPGEWETWGACSATCGYGQKKRKRTCIIGICEQTQTKICNLKVCEDAVVRQYKEWQKWGPCSVTCGIGTHKRRRQCVVGFCEEVMRKTCFTPPCPGTKVKDLYTPWVAWSSCSVTCDGGERRRTRKCKPPGGCVQTQSQTCFPKACGSVGPSSDRRDRYHNWGDWSACSVTCGVGEETRTRRCKFGNCEQVAERACRLKICVAEPKYEEWSQWTECSATCGDGEIMRMRTYANGTGTQRQLQYCNLKRCETKDTDKYGNWLDWSKCTATCNSGLRIRVRFCKVGSCEDSETETCNEGNCGPAVPKEKYGAWQSWGDCSTTCGNGIAYRKRLCKIGTCEETTSKTCRLKACPPEYTPWEEWGECSVNCGPGVSTRKRYCTVGSCEEKQERPCKMSECGVGWGNWAEWRGCDKTCGVGFDYRTRECKEKRPSALCPGGIFDYKPCNTQPCVAAGKWGPWSKWSKCDVTCGLGQSTRSRTCAEGLCEGEDKEAKPCNTVECIKVRFSNWSAWGKCSVSCGAGERSRRRTCIGGERGDEGCLGRLLAKEECDGPPCVKPKWGKWSRWQPCSVTCGRGTSKRERVCVGGARGAFGCKGPASSTRRCNRPECKTVKWGEWSDWKACSEPCDGGTTWRTRSCSGGSTGDRGCIGDDMERKSCNTARCPEDDAGSWTEWSAWSACSSTCGIGTILRNRVCRGGKNDCVGESQEVNVCIKENCAARWGDWSSWSACSATCDIGLALRIRRCEGGIIGSEGCKEVDQESRICTERSCNEALPEPLEPLAVWLPWTDWSACPVTCDMGTQSRSRKCTRQGACDGESEEARYCNIHECPTEVPAKNLEERWAEWGKWEDCPVPCGTGTSHRMRICVGGTAGTGGCEGRAAQHRKCKKEDCQWSAWGIYSECSQTCGKGTKTRSRLCADGVMEVEKCHGSRMEVADCEDNKCHTDSDIRCAKVAHPLNGKAISTSNALHKIGDEIIFLCDAGYKAKGEGKIKCQSDGRWSGPVPYCAAAESCRRVLRGVAAAQICGDACKSDNDCSGKREKCLCDERCGKSCLRPDTECKPLTSPENGYIIGDVRTHGYTATYGCNVGFFLVGTQTRRCRSDGQWTGFAAECYPYNTPGIAGKSLQHAAEETNANLGSWPWQALILLNENGLADESLKSMIGGGSVINQNWILTAAHVLRSRDNIYRDNGIVIALGVTLMSQNNRTLPEYVQLYQPELLITHEKFDSRTLNNDIGLIKLGKRLKVDGTVLVVDGEAVHGKIVFSEFVRPVALPCISACDVEEKNEVRNGIRVKGFKQTECSKHGRELTKVTNDDVVVSGYLKSTSVNQRGDATYALQEVFLRLLPKGECIDGVKKIRKDRGNERFTPGMLCTGRGEEGDACQGVGGGPLVKQVSSKAGKACWVQIGIVSWGWACADMDTRSTHQPLYFTDTSSLMSWVVATTRKNA